MNQIKSKFTTPTLSNKTRTPISYNKSTQILKDKDDAQRKKQEMLQALQERKRQEREEKHLKAQQLREMSQKQKEEHLVSAEKQKQIQTQNYISNKQAKLEKRKHESDLRRQAAVQRAIIEKKKQNLPIYLAVTEMPPLPTADYRENEDCDDKPISNANRGEIFNGKGKNILVNFLKYTY